MITGAGIHLIGHTGQVTSERFWAQSWSSTSLCGRAVGWGLPAKKYHYLSIALAVARLAGERVSSLLLAHNPEEVLIEILEVSCLVTTA